MINIVGFGHINIVVDSIEKATNYYIQLLDAKPIQFFSGFKNKGFAKSAGFLKNPENVNVSISFLKIPNTEIYLELMCYHSPCGSQHIARYQPNDLGGVRHLCLRVKNIEDAFEKIKNFDGAALLNKSPEYRPFKLDHVQPEEFIFFDDQMNNDLEAKIQSAAVSSEISFFYFTDLYGVIWELEEVPDNVSDPALEL